MPANISGVQCHFTCLTHLVCAVQNIYYAFFHHDTTTKPRQSISLPENVITANLWKAHRSLCGRGWGFRTPQRI